MQIKETEVFIRTKLANELPANLHYHTVDHINDVLNAALTLAKMENIDEYDLQLLKTAVLFHDSGFIVNGKNHEMVSCSIATENLSKFDFTKEETDRICGMIMATKIPQTPHNHLEEIICDADLDYLGRDDYDSISNKLFLELNEHGNMSEKDWLKLQINFLEQHHYFTVSAQKMRKEKKEQKLSMLKEKLIKIS